MEWEVLRGSGVTGFGSRFLLRGLSLRRFPSYLRGKSGSPTRGSNKLPQDSAEMLTFRAASAPPTSYSARQEGFTALPRFICVMYTAVLSLPILYSYQYQFRFTPAVFVSPGKVAFIHISSPSAMCWARNSQTTRIIWYARFDMEFHIEIRQGAPFNAFSLWFYELLCSTVERSAYV